MHLVSACTLGAIFTSILPPRLLISSVTVLRALVRRSRPRSLSSEEVVITYIGGAMSFT